MKSVGPLTEVSITCNVNVLPYSLKQLAALYHIHRDTFKAWIKKHEARIGKRCGRFYNTQQVEIIFSIFGIPEELTLRQKDHSKV